jgi:hypothetical protein
LGSIAEEEEGNHSEGSCNHVEGGHAVPKEGNRTHVEGGHAVPKVGNHVEGSHSTDPLHLGVEVLHEKHMHARMPVHLSKNI